MNARCRKVRVNAPFGLLSSRTAGFSRSRSVSDRSHGAIVDVVITDIYWFPKVNVMERLNVIICPAPSDSPIELRTALSSLWATETIDPVID